MARFNNSRPPMKLLTPVVLQAALALAVLILIQAGYVWHTTRQGIADRLKEHERAFAPVLSEALWNMDPRSQKAIAEGISTLPSVSGVQIYNPDTGRLLASAGVTPVGTAETISGSTVQRTFFVNYIHDTGTDHVGRVVLYGDSSELAAAARRAVVLSSVSLLLFLALLYLILRRHLTRHYRQPLARLSASLATPDGSPLPLEKALPAIEAPELRGTDPLFRVLTDSLGSFFRKISQEREQQVQGETALRSKITELEQSVEKLQQKFQDSAAETEIMEEALQTERSLRQALLDSRAAGTAVLDRTGNYSQAGGTMSVMLGYSSAEIVRMGPMEITHPEDRSDSARQLKALLDGTVEGYRLEKRFLCRDGSDFWADTTVTAVPDESGGIAGAVEVIIDTTLRRQLEADLRLSEAGYLLLAENTDEIVWTADNEFRFTYVSPSVQRMLGVYPEEALALPPETFLPAEVVSCLREGCRKEPAYLGKGGSRGFPMELPRMGGGTVAAEVFLRRRYDREGLPDGFVGVVRDVSEHRAMRERLEKLAALDELTGLSNRGHFLEQFRREIARCARHNCETTLLLADLENFKKINDTYGHVAGDRLLRAVSSVFTETLRTIDVIGRIGDAEFAILLPETAVPEALIAAERLKSNFDALEVNCKEGFIQFAVNIGITGVHGDDDLESLLRRASAIVDEAKRNGGLSIFPVPEQ